MMGWRVLVVVCCFCFVSVGDEEMWILEDLDDEVVCEGVEMFVLMLCVVEVVVELVVMVMCVVEGEDVDLSEWERVAFDRARMEREVCEFEIRLCLEEDVLCVCERLFVEREN